jgi:hypothetical protein
VETLHDPEDQAAVDAPPEERDEPEMDPPAPARRWWQRRRYQVAAALGLVAALGTGALVVASTGLGRAGAGSGGRSDRSEEHALTVTTSGSLPKDHHTLKVVSALDDLSGQHELAWAADSGHPVGDARCTQNFRIGPSAAAKVRPTMLLCWRTSADRSVYTVAVDLDQRPSEKASVATINEVWSKLG